MEVGERSKARVELGKVVNGKIGLSRYDIVGRVLMTRGVNSGYR